MLALDTQLLRLCQFIFLPGEYSNEVDPRGDAPVASDKSDVKQPGGSNRRQFLGRVGMAATAAGVLGSVPRALAKSASSSVTSNTVDTGSLNTRVKQSYSLRLQAASVDSQIPIPPHTTNGDENRYPDKSASYSKGLLQDNIDVVNPAAWASFKKALISGNMADYEAIILGGTRLLNGPQGSYAFDLEGRDSVQFGDAPDPSDPAGPEVVPPFAPVASADYGTQLTEMYWGAMCRDVAFTDYPTNPTAIAAAAELSSMPGYRGPRDSQGNVTPALLFRGGFPGETVGPYISQFFITPTSFGAQPLTQQMQSFLPGIDYMTDLITFQQVQNGISTGQVLQDDPTLRYRRNGRDLAAYTHSDVLYQAYFTAFLVMSTIGAPLNPGNPYFTSKTQNGFDTFGAPDFAASLGEVAAKCLHRVWFQKWLIHLVHRPESGGAIVQQLLSGNQSQIDARLNSNVLNSQAVANSFSQYGTYLLPQAFPEGSPTHPSYPTGHGTVGGACITLLKFFFDENFVIPAPMVPTTDGLSLIPYTGGDAGQITVGGELNKLAHNVTFGHGIHAGIHWRQDSDVSMQLGEAFAISLLQDRAHTYHEKFSISFTKLDGTKVTISNP